MISNSSFLEIEKALDDKVPFLIHPHSLLRIEKFEIFSRILSTYSQEWKNAPIKNAIWLQQYLHDASNQKRESHDPNQIIDTVRSFLGQYKQYAKSDAFNHLNIELIAYRLKIPSNALDEKINPGFLSFATKSYLHNSLSTHNHQLLVDKDHKISILYKDEYISWEDAKPIAENFLAELEKQKEAYSISFYGYRGLECRQRTNWKKPKAFLKGDTSLWAPHFIKKLPFFDGNNKAYAIEFCSSATGNAPKTVGDHTWVRLYSFKQKDDKILGKMYTTGFYRPNKNNCKDHFDTPFRIKPGFLTEDVSEVWGINDKIKTVAMQIDQSQLISIKKRIQADKENSEIPFQLFSLNCDHYASDIGHLAGIQLPTKRHFFELFIFSFSEEKYKNSKKPIQIAAKIAHFILKIFLYLCTPLFNAILWFGGAGIIDSKVKTPIRPIFASFSDLWDQNNLYPYSPWVLGHTVKNEVEEWRRREIEKLDLNQEDDRKKQAKIEFSLPPHYIVNSALLEKFNLHKSCSALI